MTQVEFPFGKVKLPPPLKWAGGKRWLLPHLIPLWMAHRKSRLVEPFCGGISIALGLMPKKALLNDINPHLINFYRQLQEGLAIPETFRVDEEGYYENREAFNQLLREKKETTAEAAVLFYYLNKTCYNGLCRFNSSGEFNVPFGKYKTINYSTTLMDYREVLHGWKFSKADFTGIAIKPNDFIYADPPYDVGFTHYSKGGFTWNDQERIARWLAAQTVPVVLSNRATPRIIDLYNSLGFDTKVILPGPRRISCNGDRTPALEVVATRNL